MKILVSYLYKEDDRTRENLAFFLKHGFVATSAADFILIINGHVCTVPLPESPNFRVVRRENSLDLQAFRDALDRTDLCQYDQYIFLNSSCVGPFVPAYATTPWFELVTSRLDDTIKLVAPIIEIPPDRLGSECLPTHRHVAVDDRCVPFAHTYLFATDRTGLDILLRYGALPNLDIPKDQMIQKFERLVTSSLLNEGYGIASLLMRFRDVDFRDKRNWHYLNWANDGTTCCETPGHYAGIDVAPLEVMFVKTIRSPHRHRRRRNSGLSPTLANYVRRYVTWTENPRANFDHELSLKRSALLKLKKIYRVFFRPDLRA